MNPILKKAVEDGLPRRQFLQNFLLTAGSVSAASYLTACSSSPDAAPGPSPTVPGLDPEFKSQFEEMGPLLDANGDGIKLPAGFTSRELAIYNNFVQYDVDDGELPADSRPFMWHSDPDGGGTFRTADGGWIYISNTERRDATSSGLLGGPHVTREEAQNLVPPFGTGGVSALQFAPDGKLINAYAVQRNTSTNCSGGATPWGTWINGEEIRDGLAFECSPLEDGGNDLDNPKEIPHFGRKGHEMFAVHESDKAIYHTEDAGGNDRFYRTVYTDAAWPDGGKPDYEQGILQAMFVPAGLAAAQNGPTPIEWVDVIDDGRAQFEIYEKPENEKTPEEVAASKTTVLAGNEGVWALGDFIYLSNKGDPAVTGENNIWVIDTVGSTIESVFDVSDNNPPGSFVDNNEPVMTGVDNIAMTDDGEMLIAEDGGFMRVMVLLPDRRTIPLMQLPHQASDNPQPSEVTGIALGPTGDKIYVSAQRSLSQGVTTAPLTGGITYEITMPFTVKVTRPLAGSL